MAKISTTPCSHFTKYEDTHKHTLICKHAWWIDFMQIHFLFSVEESKEAKIGVSRSQRKVNLQDNAKCSRSYRGSSLLPELKIKAQTKLSPYSPTHLAFFLFFWKASNFSRLIKENVHFQFFFSNLSFYHLQIFALCFTAWKVFFETRISNLSAD